jgi:adenylate cyclase
MSLRSAIMRLVDCGTAGYPPPVRRRLRIMNVTAFYVALFTLVYTLQQAVLDARTWAPIIIVNLCLMAVALSVPLLHRFGPIAGVLGLGAAESIGLFVLLSYLGRDSGLQVQYIATICVYFVVIGLQRIRLIIALTAVSLLLYVLAWGLFPEPRLVVSAGDMVALNVTAAATTFTILAVVLYYAFHLAEAAQAESDALLHNILPRLVVERLKETPRATIADEIAEGSVLFADLKGFVPIARQLGPVRCVRLLGVVVNAFDQLADQWGVEKIKTIGDAYMAAAGLPDPAADHAERIAHMALAMLETARRISEEEQIALSLRIGIASGPILAGVIGAKRLAYDIWGDTVNFASRLEGLSTPGRILISTPTRHRLAGTFALEPCGPLDVKGFGLEEVWYLLARQT